VAIAFDAIRCIGTARALSDGVGNADIIDLWTKREYRRRGIASELATKLTAAVKGQDVYLQTDDPLDLDEPKDSSRSPTAYRSSSAHTSRIRWITGISSRLAHSGTPVSDTSSPPTVSKFEAAK
jgi:hypothetical protein